IRTTTWRSKLPREVLLALCCVLIPFLLVSSSLAQDGEVYFELNRNEMGDQGLEMVLPNDLLFGFGKSTLGANAEVALRSIAELFGKGHQLALMRGASEMPTIRIFGHTDSVGSAESNRSLSRRRAEDVKQFFIQESVPTAETFRVIAMGEDDPVAENDSEEGRAKNRRAVIFLDWDLQGIDLAGESLEDHVNNVQRKTVQELNAYLDNLAKGAMPPPAPPKTPAPEPSPLPPPTPDSPTPDGSLYEKERMVRTNELSKINFKRLVEAAADVRKVTSFIFRQNSDEVDEKQVRVLFQGLAKEIPHIREAQRNGAAIHVLVLGYRSPREGLEPLSFNRAVSVETIAQDLLERNTILATVQLVDMGAQDLLRAENQEQGGAGHHNNQAVEVFLLFL
ncbi:MAG: OmpA family protein, partial [Verrucomicrobiota bacterium]